MSVIIGQHIQRKKKQPLNTNIHSRGFGEGLFNRECSYRTRSNGFQTKRDRDKRDKRVRLDVRKKLFTVRVEVP